MSRALSFLGWALVCLFGAALPATAAPLQVVATTTMVGDLVTQVGGDRVQVQRLMGAGVDPHLYKPTATDVLALQKAKVIFYNGLLLEGRMSDLFERMGKTKKVFAVAAAIPPGELLQPEESGAHPDPHVWGDARLWSFCVEAVVRGLSEADPAGAETYKRNGERYKAELAGLHQWALQRVSEIAEEQRVLVTSHDAFSYTGRAYGFQVIGVQGISTVTEAGLADVVKTVDLIKARKVKAIFVESSVPKATIERISKDSGAKVGGELYSDAMDAPKTMKTVNGETYDAGTYIGMLKHNINTAVEALK